MFEESAKLLVWVISVVLLAVIILPQMIRILREYERGGDFSSRQAARHKRAGIDFPHSDRRSHGEDGSARRDHRRRAPGSHDTGQRADDR